MKKYVSSILILIGAVLLITAAVLWINSINSLFNWIPLILGLGASIKGWVDLLKKEKPTPLATQIAVEDRNIQVAGGEIIQHVHNYIEKPAYQPESPSLKNNTFSLLLNNLLKLQKTISEMSSLLGIQYPEWEYKDSQERDQEIMELIDKTTFLGKDLEAITVNPSLFSDETLKKVYIDLVWGKLLRNIEKLQRSKKVFRKRFADFSEEVNSILLVCAECISIISNMRASRQGRGFDTVIDDAEPKRLLKVFLCHSSKDKPKVREYYDRLRGEKDIDPWLDVEKLLPGVDWNLEIRSAVRSSDVVLVFLSRQSVNKEGYVQKEITQALDIAEEKPEGTIFIIPLRLEDCEVPNRIKRWHWLNLFEDNSYDKLLGSLRRRKNDLATKISG